MSLWTHNDASEATGGHSSKPWNAMRVEIDSRKIKPGDLFVAIVGEHMDGHQFAAQALEKGAAAVVISHTPENLPAQAPFLLVEDTLKALEALGRFARKRTRAKVVGVTGSVGKTSTREMIRLGLSAHGSTYATSGNYNNHIGTPLTLANMPMDVDFAVFEMGMNHGGEIAQLTQQVHPDIAVITNVESVHLEFFTSEQQIAEAKAEIFESMTAGSVAVLNRDNRWFDALAAAAHRRELQVIGVGEHPNAQLRLISYQAGQSTMKVDAATIELSLAAMGKHWAYGAMMALAVAKVLKLDVTKTTKALSQFREVAGRGAMQLLKSGAYLIDDSYNASPASMRAAFAKLAELERKGRLWVALGDMLELGKEGPRLHGELAVDLTAARVDGVFTAGTLMQHLHRALPEAIRKNQVAKAIELLPILTDHLQQGDILLVKGSHGSHMYQLAQALKEA